MKEIDESLSLANEITKWIKDGSAVSQSVRVLIMANAAIIYSNMLLARDRQKRLIDACKTARNVMVELIEVEKLFEESWNITLALNKINEALGDE